MEHFHFGKLFAHTDKFDRRAGDRLDGERRAAAGVAVHFGENDARNAEMIVERFGDGNGVLTGHGVCHEQDFLRIHGAFDGHELLHERFVHVEASGRVENDHGALFRLCVLYGRTGDVHRVHVRRGIKAGDVELLGQRAQLINGGGAVDVGRHEIGTHLLLAQQKGQLARRRGLAGTLKADHENDGGLRTLKLQLRVFSAEQLDQFFVNDLNHLLRRSDALHHLNAERCLTHAIHEFLDDLEVDVGFKKRESNFAKSVLDIGFRELSATAEIAEHAGESVCQAFKHRLSCSYDLELRTVTQLFPSSQVKRASGVCVAFAFRIFFHLLPSRACAGILCTSQEN